MKKKKEEFDLNKFIDEAAGYIILAIGKGEFRQELRAFMYSLNQNAYARGLEAGRNLRDRRYSEKK